MRYLIVLLFLLRTGFGFAQTLSDYLALALENSPGIKAQDLEYQSSLQRIPQAGALPDPQVNLNVFIRPMMLPMGNQPGSISAMQMFPWFGARKAMKQAAAEMAEVRRQNINLTRNELAFQVKGAWYPLLALEEQLRIQQENLRVLQLDKELATVQFQQGKAPMTDAIRADIMLDEVTTETALLEQKRAPLLAAFNTLLNRAADTPVAITESLPEPAAITLMYRDSTWLDGHPVFRVLDQQIAAAEAEQRAAEFMRKPMIGAGLQYAPLYRRSGGDLPPNTGRDMVMPMVSVTLPIWRKKYDAAVEERRLMGASYVEMKLDRHNELAAMYEMTRYELDKAIQMASLMYSQIAKTQQAIDLLLAAYRNDGANFDDILRLQRQLFRYQLELVSAKTECQLTLSKLDYLTGNWN